MSGQSDGLMERIRKAVFGDQGSSPGMKKPAAPPKRPASFYDPQPEASADADPVFGAASPTTFGAQPELAADAPVAATFPELAPVPAKLARLTEQGGVLTIAYAPLRKLGISIVISVVGTLLMGIGFLAFFTSGNVQDSWPVLVGFIAAGVLLDMLAAHLLVSNLRVVAGGGRLKVEKKGLFGAKQFEASGSSIESVGSSLSYTVTSGSKRTDYYRVSATTNDAVIPLGYGVPGEELADAIAYRVAGALRLPPGKVHALLERDEDFEDDDFEDDDLEDDDLEDKGFKDKA